MFFSRQVPALTFGLAEKICLLQSCFQKAFRFQVVFLRRIFGRAEARQLLTFQNHSKSWPRDHLVGGIEHCFFHSLLSF